MKKSMKCIFVGYSTQSKAYKWYNPLSGKLWSLDMLCLMKILTGTLILRMLVQILNCRLLKELFNKNLQQFQQEPVAVSVPGNTSRSSPTSSSCDTHQSRTSSLTSDHSLTHQGSGSSSSSGHSSSDTPPAKFRSLREI